MPAEPDVLIIGAGVVGLSIAFHLDAARRVRHRARSRRHRRGRLGRSARRRYASNGARGSTARSRVSRWTSTPTSGSGCRCESIRASARAATSSSRTPRTCIGDCGRTSTTEQPRRLVADRLARPRRPSSCRVSTSRTWSAVRGAPRTATSTGRSRSSRPSAHWRTCRLGDVRGRRRRRRGRLQSGDELAPVRS